MLGSSEAKPRSVHHNRRALTPRRDVDSLLNESLQDRLRFEQLVSELSAKFVNVRAEDVDDAINTALGRVSTFMKSELSTFIVRDPDSGLLRHSHQWVANGTHVAIDFTDFNIEKQAPWLARELTKLAPIPIARIQDFPREAGAERALAESLGVKSILWVPISIDGALIGCIALNTVKQEAEWSKPIVQRLRLLGEVFANALVRKHVEEVLDERLRFERLLSELSTRFVHLPARDVDKIIEDALARVGEFVGADETFVIGDSPEPSPPDVTHGWFANGVVRELKFKGKDLLKTFPWLAARLNVNERVVLSSRNELPPEAYREREYFESVGLDAALVYPLSVGGKLFGVLFVQSFHSRQWPEGVVERFQLVADLFANALSRKADDERISKAFGEIEKLEERLQAENSMLREQSELRHRYERFVGDSDAIEEVLSQAEQVADTNATVLIQGETGTGKELLAQTIHQISSRHNRPMITVNCAALPATLMEAELFGREKGAYTGALTKQIGRFELADGATIFLDEIGELPLELQVKLLRVLQHGQFERLGSAKTITVDARVIAATNRDLAQSVREGAFREDLYYRVSVFPVTVPPLRERREDIPALVWAFVREFGESMGKTIDSIAQATMGRLQSYPWPGNVRELRNVIERGMILSRDRTLRFQLPAIQSGDTGQLINLAEVEKRHIITVLKKTRWRIRGRNGAAELLGLKPSTLYSRMDKLAIERPKS